MPDHPSIQGLREAVGQATCILDSTRPVCSTFDGRVHAECYEAAQAAYLTEHGVLLSGEGLVRAQEVTFLRRGDSFDYYRLVLVPQDGE